MAVVIDGTNGISSPDYEVDGVTGQVYPVVSGTAVTASGTSVDFTGIPSWVKRITVMFSGMSTSGTSNILVQLGDSGGFEITGYLGAGMIASGSTPSVSNYTAGFGFPFGTATNIMHGSLFITKIDGNTWVANGALSRSDGTSYGTTAGSKTLSATLDRVRITTVNGTDTFDAGTINILYE
jgi:hypothetical protein